MLLALRAGVSYGRPPTEMLGHRWVLHDRLTARDRLLAVAHELLERSICDGCGLSSFLTTHADYEGHFSVKDDNPPDLACEAIGRFRDRREKSKTEPKPGERLGVIFDFDPGKAVADGGS